MCLIYLQSLNRLRCSPCFILYAHASQTQQHQEKKEKQINRQKLKKNINISQNPTIKKQKSEYNGISQNKRNDWQAEKTHKLLTPQIPAQQKTKIQKQNMITNNKWYKNSQKHVLVQLCFLYCPVLCSLCFFKTLLNVAEFSVCFIFWNVIYVEKGCCFVLSVVVF